MLASTEGMKSKNSSDIKLEFFFMHAPLCCVFWQLPLHNDICAESAVDR